MLWEVTLTTGLPQVKPGRASYMDYSSVEVTQAYQMRTEERSRWFALMPGKMTGWKEGRRKR